MAERINTYQWVKQGRPRHYPWPLWLNGEIWRLKQDEDFSVEVDHMRAQAGKAARNLGKKLRTTTEDETTLVIQAFS